MAISEGLLPEFDREMANTRTILAAVPDDKLAWKPHEKSMTLGRLAGHVAEMPVWGKMTVDTDVLDVTPGGGPPVYTAYDAPSRDHLVETFDTNVANARKAIEGASDEHLMKIWSLVYGGKTVMSMPRAAVLRSMVMNHLIHHRGQLSVYLRLVDVAVPGMYGPSADQGSGFAA